MKLGPFNITFGTRQAAPLITRRFDGASGGRRGNGVGTFGPINSEVAAAGSTLRSRSRHLVQNNSLIANGVRNLATAMTGAGIMPTPMHPDAETRAALMTAWRAWSDEADADGRTDLSGIEAQVARALIVDGEALLQVIRTDEGPRIRHIPVELLGETMCRPTEGGYIFSGVEFNATGQRIAYHIFPARADHFQTYAQPIRVPADEILHIFEPLAAGQVRGIPWMASIILPASELDQMTDALLVGAKVAAMMAGFIINSNDTGGGDPFDGQDMPSLEPGTLQRLPGGTDIKFSTPQQAQQTGEFVKAQIRSLAAGLGIPAHWLDCDLSGANYSSLRAGLLPVRARLEQVQYLTLVPQMLNPIWREFVEHTAITGDFPGYENDPQAALAVEWLPPVFMQVDPMKQVQADIAELEAGLTSRRKLVASRGWSIEDLDAERAAEAATAPKKESV